MKRRTRKNKRLRWPGDEMLIVAPDGRRHSDELFDMLDGVFGRGEGGFGRACREYYVARSRYDWAASRIGILDGRIVTHWGVWDYRMRIGSARVRVGGIGAVATHGDYRKRGLVSRTARASTEAMRELGYDMSRLGGIPDFYHRFGYVRGWSEVCYFVRVDELPRRSGVRTKRFKVKHREDTARLYNRQYARTTGTAVRPTFLRHTLAVDGWDGYLWADGDGELSGYVVVRRPGEGKSLKCCEYAGDAETALGVLANLARRFKCDEIEFDSIPYESALARLLRRGNCRAETRYRRCAGSMIRTVNLRSTLSKLRDELSRRLKRSPLKGWGGGLLVADAREKVMLAIDRGRVRVAPGLLRRSSRFGCEGRARRSATAREGADPRPTKHAVRGGEQVAQLILGTDHPGEIVEASGMRLTGDARELVDVLFPAQHPVLSFADRF